MSRKLLISTCLIVQILLISSLGEAKQSESLRPDDITAATSALQCPSSDPVAVQLYNLGIELSDDGNFAQAETAYREAITRDQGYCDAMDNLGLLLRRQGKLGEAILWYQRSLQVKPDDGVAHQNLGAAYKAQGELEKSEAEFLWLTQHEPQNPEGFYGLGMILLKEERIASAIEDLEVAEKLYRATESPLVNDTWYLLGIAYFQKDDCQKAKKYLLLAYPVVGEEGSVNYLLGICYLDNRGKDIRQATEYLHKAKNLGVDLPPEIEKQLGP